MKRNFKKLLLVVLVGIFAFSSLNIVNAISSSGDLPISYEITGFNVFIFNDKGMTQTQTEASAENIKEIPVDGLKYTTTDEVKSEHGYTLVSTKLNVNGGIEGVEKIAENIASKNKSSLTGGNNGKYLITFSVNYKLNLPANTSVYDSDYHNVFSGDQKLLKNETEANKTHGLDQMLIAGVYDANSDTVDWNNQAQYVYNVEVGTHTFTSRSYLMPDFDQYLIFTNDKKPADTDIEDPYNHVMKDSYGETYRYVAYLSDTDIQIDDPQQNEPLPDDSANNNNQKDENKDDKNDNTDTVVPDTPSDKDKNDNNDNNHSTVTPNDNNNNKDKDEDNKQDNNNDTTPVVPSNTNNDNNNNNNSNNSGASNLASNNSNTGKTTTLAVPNTADNSNVNLTLSGVLLLASGFGIIKLTKKENSI